MTCFCTRCGINWAELHSVDDEVNDEQYEFCPVCHTDSFLVDAVDGPRYIQVLDGTVIDVTTKQPIAKQLEVVEQVKRFSYSDFLAAEQQWQNKQTAALEAYHKAFDQQGKQAAEQAYFETFKND